MRERFSGYWKKRETRTVQWTCGSINWSPSCIYLNSAGYVAAIRASALHYSLLGHFAGGGGQWEKTDSAGAHRITILMTSFGISISRPRGWACLTELLEMMMRWSVDVSRMPEWKDGKTWQWLVRNSSKSGLAKKRKICVLWKIKGALPCKG